MKLDIFHAVKRISDKIPKRHPLRNDCMRDLSMVFRDPQDSGESRLMDTPAPSVLIGQLDKFLQSGIKQSIKVESFVTFSCKRSSEPKAAYVKRMLNRN